MTIVGMSIGSISDDEGLIIYYAVVKNVEGEAMKPWLGGESQPKGIVGVGTYKRNAVNDEENPSPQ
jgi:hypothetical protein